VPPCELRGAVPGGSLRWRGRWQARPHRQGRRRDGGRRRALVTVQHTPPTEHDAARVAPKKRSLALDNGVDPPGLRSQVRLIQDVMLELAIPARVVIVPGGNVCLGACRPADGPTRRMREDIFNPWQQAKGFDSSR